MLHLAWSRALEGHTAVYLHKMAPRDVDARAADAGVGRALWEASEAVVARARGSRSPPGTDPAPRLPAPEGGPTGAAATATSTAA